MPRRRSAEEVCAFSWGYEGWGNSTRQLVRAYTEAERQRGFGPPMFVDVRIRRSVRAEGFRESAFEHLLGHSGYRWMPSLGNQAIVSGGDMRLACASAREQLLDLIIDLAPRRRVIFFCHCKSFDGCHRSFVAPELARAARRRRFALHIAEWPGGAPRSRPLELQNGARNRKFIPVPRGISPSEAVRVSPGTPARLPRGGEVLVGPAVRFGGRWQFPVLKS